MAKAAITGFQEAHIRGGIGTLLAGGAAGWILSTKT